MLFCFFCISIQYHICFNNPVVIFSKDLTQVNKSQILVTSRHVTFLADILCFFGRCVHIVITANTVLTKLHFDFAGGNPHAVLYSRIWVLSNIAFSQSLYLHLNIVVTDLEFIHFPQTSQHFVQKHYVNAPFYIVKYFIYKKTRQLSKQL